MTICKQLHEAIFPWQHFMLPDDYAHTNLLVDGVWLPWTRTSMVEATQAVHSDGSLNADNLTLPPPLWHVHTQWSGSMDFNTCDMHMVITCTHDMCCLLDWWNNDCTLKIIEKNNYNCVTPSTNFVKSWKCSRISWVSHNICMYVEQLSWVSSSIT